MPTSSWPGAQTSGARPLEGLVGSQNADPKANGFRAETGCESRPQKLKVYEVAELVMDRIVDEVGWLALRGEWSVGAFS